jgi:hypothetical protein
MNFKKEKIINILEKICKINYKYSYLSIIMKYSYPQSVFFDEELIKKKYRLLINPDTYWKCNHKKEYSVFLQETIINGLTRKEIQFPFKRFDVCLNCYLHQISFLKFHNFRIFDYNTGNKLFGNRYKGLSKYELILEYELNPECNIPRFGY